MTSGRGCIRNNGGDSSSSNGEAGTPKSKLKRTLEDARKGADEAAQKRADAMMAVMRDMFATEREEREERGVRQKERHEETTESRNKKMKIFEEISASLKTVTETSQMNQKLATIKELLDTPGLDDAVRKDLENKRTTMMLNSLK